MMIVSFLFYIIGIIGNSIVVSVYCLDPVKNSNTVLLLALAILDNILLVDGLFSNVLHSGFPYTGAGHVFWDYKDYFFIVSNPISHWAQNCR